MPKLSTSTATCQMPQLTTAWPHHSINQTKTKTMWNDWENFTAHRASSESHASRVPTQSPLQPTWCHLLVERDPEGLSCFQHFAALPSQQDMASDCCEHPGKVPRVPLLLSSSLQVLLAVIPANNQYFPDLLRNVLLLLRGEVQGVSILFLNCFAQSLSHCGKQK